MRHRYPFDALHWLRRERVDRQAAVVSESALRTAHARRDEARAEAERQSTERRFDEQSDTENARLSEGLVRAGELQVAAEWRKGAKAQLELKVEREHAARAARMTEAAAEVTARRELGSISNEAKVIDTHRTEWHAERDAARERADEEAAAEQWTASHYRARR